MNNLLAALNIGSFETLLAAYAKTYGGKLSFSCVDGGAAAGTCTEQMLAHIDSNSRVYAFEPFPGNHPFFHRIQDKRAILIPKALAAQKDVLQFYIPSIVKKGSEWASKGFEGYSSVGYLLPRGSNNSSGATIEVECVSLDDELSAHLDNIGFIKLDLQGGELNALKGMHKLLQAAHFLWIEFSFQPGLLDYLQGLDYLLFDTEYFFIGDPTAEATARFQVSKENVALSTGKSAWFGFPKTASLNYAADWADWKERFQLIQTDLVCVNRKHLRSFVNALSLI